MSEFKQTCFILNKNDNVGTALCELYPGIVKTIGSTVAKLEIIEEIATGHKVALYNIKCGDQIIKYGVTIAQATSDIKLGQWVHLHNCTSLYDERSENLDINTGKALDTLYN